MATFVLNSSLTLRDVFGKACEMYGLYGLNPNADFSNINAVRVAWYPAQDYTSLPPDELVNVRYPTDDELIAAQTAILDMETLSTNNLAIRTSIRNGIATVKSKMDTIRNTTSFGNTTGQRLGNIESAVKQIADAVYQITRYVEMDLSNKY